MLRLLVKNGSRKANVSCAQLGSFFSTKSSKGNDVNLGENIDLGIEHPMHKVWRCIKRDVAMMKKNVKFWKDEKNPAIDEKTNRVIDWDDPNAPIFPNHCDIVIIGGGAIGSATAYWCKKIFRGSLRVVVIEKDPCNILLKNFNISKNYFNLIHIHKQDMKAYLLFQYTQCSTVLSVGGLRQQFSLEENIEMSLFGAEFIRNANEYLGIEGEPVVDLQFHPYGYLSLATEESVDILKRNHKLQKSLGAKNVLLNKFQLKSKFPWLTTDDIELGCLGLQNEGWFDPWLLLCSLKRKAMSMGVEYITATAKGFNFKVNPNVHLVGVPPGEYEQLEYLVVETEDGKLRPITFSKCIVAAGAFSGEVAKMARIGTGRGILKIPLPVEPRKRYVYCFHAPDGPGLNTPLTIDPTGVYFRREGLANNYICGRSPEEHEEPAVDNLDVDPEFFENNVWPVLAKRVKAFENLKVKSSWAGYYEFNTLDENGVIGSHPYHQNLLFATGFSGHGIQKAPAIGRAISELIVDKSVKEVNIW
ncbi:hypothetical protein TSAR_006171 [Trichomalopsis sarcophagae]|uniref:FAD-dependent oxidoreductase domain-containing protein 1 n=1 Tax=Trichomalopsis sarcophagae TaxID=543379 RepID=A0A232EG46_9HYME|nr:hypothetical protein TSAR_006171 [Trichomalopsis sarcophagae]